MDSTDYFEHNARREGVAQRPRRPLAVIPPADDPLASTIRVALDARRLGLSEDRTLELMEQAGLGIEVEEQAVPR